MRYRDMMYDFYYAPFMNLDEMDMIMLQKYVDNVPKGRLIKFHVGRPTFAWALEIRVEKRFMSEKLKGVLNRYGFRNMKARDL